MSLLEEYPLHPAYRGTGEHHLLLWSHHYNRGKLTIARSWKALVHNWHTRWAQDDAGDPIAYVNATIIAPPFDIRGKYARECYQHDLDQFARTVVSLLPDYRKFHGGNLPPGITTCKNYENKHDPDEKEKDDRSHYSCKNCQERAAADWEGLFAKHKAVLVELSEPRYLRMAQARKAILSKRVYPVQAEPDKPVYYVSENGNWSSPSAESLFSQITPETFEYNLSSNFYFFFQGEIQDVRKDKMWTAPVRSAQADAKAREQKQQKEFLERKAATAAKNNSIVERIFS